MSLNTESMQLFGELNRLVGDFDGAGELESLEDALSEFNLFEALGSINSEIRHSNFLGWIFDPNNNHGLGDIVVKRFLQRALNLIQPSHELNAVGLDLMDLSDLEVRREWYNIDLLLISPTNKLAIAIENKIGAAESKGQLERYKKRVETEFPASENWKTRFIFLTIDGTAASDESYIAMPHSQIVDLLESVARNRREALADDIEMAINHYTQMMRRHHMENSELISLARKIYAKHKTALEYIFMHRPDAWSDTRKVLITRLKADSRIQLDASIDRTIYVRCFSREWDKWETFLNQGTGWKSAGSDQFLLFEFVTDKSRERARLQLVLGPGDPQIREAIISKFLEGGLYKGTVYPRWTTVISKQWRMLSNDGQVDPERNADALIEDLNQMIAREGPLIKDSLESAFGVNPERQNPQENLNIKSQSA
jgi:hypothetical protein